MEILRGVVLPLSLKQDTITHTIMHSVYTKDLENQTVSTVHWKISCLSTERLSKEEHKNVLV